MDDPCTQLGSSDEERYPYRVFRDLGRGFFVSGLGG
jgi:hypothetical protein